MKRFISALALCTSLLIGLSIILFPQVAAKENPLLTLLNLPAPPPPNPLVIRFANDRDPDFYKKGNPPKDIAQIDELLEYWGRQSNGYTDREFNPKPSDAAAERIYETISKNPKILSNYLNILPNGQRSANFVKDLYDREGTDGVYPREERLSIKKWLTYHSPFFSHDLARIAERSGDLDEYVTHQEELLALTLVDFDRAKPILDRIIGDSSQKASKVLAKWALYKRALDTGSTSDIESLRGELKAVVEDKSATNGMRDLALDALTKEKEWEGRDDWYYTLLSDETLADLKVNGQTYTGLTTLLNFSPDDKYIAKMIELVDNDNPHIRSAAVRNLIRKMNTNNPQIIKALLPWLENPDWAADSGNVRGSLVNKLGELEIPESVPGLIRILDEKRKIVAYQPSSNMASNSPYYASNSIGNASNMAAVRRSGIEAANAAAYAAANAMANAANSVQYSNDREQYPYRNQAVLALTKQKDARAIHALRRILPDGFPYERANVVKAILACDGFTIAEQLDGLAIAAKGVREEMDAVDETPTLYAQSNYAGNKYANNGWQPGPMTQSNLHMILGEQLMQSETISDELARAVVDRIESIESKDHGLAKAYRKMILRWQNSAINTMLLRDIKRGIADADTMVLLLSQRKLLREQNASDIGELRSGKSIAVGFAACLYSEPSDYEAILNTDDVEAKTAMFACARLVRAQLPVKKVAENLKSENSLLRTAAERYLESEDSPEARAIVLSLHPDQYKILGARTAFFVDGSTEINSQYLWQIYQSLNDESLYNGWYSSGNDEELIDIEKSLQAEIKKDESLVGVYAFDRHYVRIYKDRVIFSWDEDDARYRERAISKREFDGFTDYLSANKVDELPPFLLCGGDYCQAKELVMLGRGGGRRLYVNGNYESINHFGGFDFFIGLEKYFADLKRSPATLKYALSREIPGLEIVMASDDIHADTVWSEGNDTRFAGSLRAVRKKVTDEIENDGEDVFAAVDYQESKSKKNDQHERRRFEGYDWYKVANGDFTPGAAQPPQIEFITIRDGHEVQPSDEQWKARFGDFEIRSSIDGLFKLARGKLTKLRSGNYENAVVTNDGRWVVVRKTVDETGSYIVRVDLATNREYPFLIDGYGERYPSAFVPFLNRILVTRDDSYYDDYYSPADIEDDVVLDDPDLEAMTLVSPYNGSIVQPKTEFRPLDQQTFRPLQKASNPNEFWAAIPNAAKHRTEVGIYNTKSLTFSPIMVVPKIRFNSMNMWVNETVGKVFFVYRGHVLALPLKK